MIKFPVRYLILLVTMFLTFTSSTHSVEGNSSQDFAGRLFAIQALPGDEIDTAIVVDFFPFTDSRSAQTATHNEKDPILNCSPYADQYSVWYVFSTPSRGRMAVDTFGSEHNTAIGIFTQTDNALDLIACNDDIYGNIDADIYVDLVSRTEFNVQQGRTYYVQIASWDILSDANNMLEVSFEHLPMEPLEPGPVNGQNDVPTLNNLSWLGSSPNGVPVTYTVAFGTSNPPPTVATVSEPLCNSSGGAGGLEPGVYDTTVAGRPALVIVGENYDPSQPSRLGFYLHGDDGGYEYDWVQDGLAGLINQKGWIFVAPQAPQTSFDELLTWRWYQYPRENAELLASVFEEMFAEYNLCQDMLFGAAASGGSVFYTRSFVPYRGETYPARVNLHCGAGLTKEVPYWDEENITLAALAKYPDTVASTEFKFTFGTDDFLADQVHDSIDIYRDAGFNTIDDELPSEGHCTYESWDKIISYFEQSSFSSTRYGYAPGDLTPDTTYYWQVTATDSEGSYVGPLWQFTTDSAYVPAPSPELVINNFTSGETVHYDLPLLKGTASGSNSITISAAGTAITWSINNGRWRAFVPLKIGENTIQIETDQGNESTFILYYEPQENSKTVRLAYPRGSDSAGAFDAPVGEPNALENALPRIRLAGRILQSMMAELFYEKGLERQTFNLMRDENHEPVVATPVSSLTIAGLQSLEEGDLRSHYADLLSDLSNGDDVIDIAIMADSHYQPESDIGAASAHQSSGGLILLESTTLYSYAETLAELESHFTDSTDIEPYLISELVREPEYWSAYTGSIGIILYYMGYQFGLSQPEELTLGNVMYQGLYYLNRMAVTYEYGWGDINPATEIMPRWTDKDAATLQQNAWLTSAGSGQPTPIPTSTPVPNHTAQPPENHPIYLPSIHKSNAAASAPPTIAFVSQRDGNEEIYTMKLDGSGLTRLTNNSDTDSGPSWSPDGSQIAFHSHRDGYHQLYVMNADGSEQRRIVDSGIWDEWVYWSPDGSQMTFIRVADHNEDGFARGEVFVIDSDGRNARRLTVTTGDTDGYGHSCWPSGWTSDSAQIVYYCYIDGTDSIWIMNADGTNQRKIVQDEQWNAMPSISPDGSTVLFSSFRDNNMEIYKGSIDGTNLVRLTNSPAYDWRPIWSADGRQILFESESDGETQVFMMNADGSGQIQITPDGFYNGQAVWKP